MLPKYHIFNHVFSFSSEAGQISEQSDLEQEVAWSHGKGRTSGSSGDAEVRHRWLSLPKPLAPLNSYLIHLPSLQWINPLFPFFLFFFFQITLNLYVSAFDLHVFSLGVFKGIALVS